MATLASGEDDSGQESETTTKVPVVLRVKRGRNIWPSLPKRSSPPGRPRGDIPIYFFVIKILFMFVLCLAFVAYASNLTLGLQRIAELDAESKRSTLVSTAFDYLDNDESQQTSKWFSLPSLSELKFGLSIVAKDDNIFTKLLNTENYFNDDSINELNDDIRKARNSLIAASVIGILTTIVAFFGASFENFWIIIITTTLYIMYAVGLLFKITTIYEIIPTLVAIILGIVYAILLKVVVQVYAPVGVIPEKA